MSNETRSKIVTLAGPASAEYTEKKSVFIASVSPVESEEEAVGFVREVRKKYSDARHNVYAYRLGEGSVSRYSDDGEPQGTAGIPVLDIINKGGFTDAVIVVTRYFGGILLGAGGLVRAYSTAARMGVDAAGIIVRRMYTVFSLSCSYTDHGRLMPILSDDAIINDGVRYTDHVTVTAAIPEEDYGKFVKNVTEATSGRAVVTQTGHRFDRK